MEKFPVNKRIENLKKIKPDLGKIISVYLGVNEKKCPNLSFLITQFNSLIHKFLKQGEYKDSVKKIADYLEQLDTRGVRGVVFFVSRDLFEVFELEFYIPTSLTISEAPNLEPLIDGWRRHIKYLVLVADRSRARLFTVHFGKIEEHKDIFNGHVPQKVKQINEAWGQDARIRGHIEDHLHRHLLSIAEKTKEFAQGKGINFLIVGGHRSIIPKIKDHLSLGLKRRIAGEFVTELKVPLNEILLRSKKVARDIYERKYQMVFMEE